MKEHILNGGYFVIKNDPNVYLFQGDKLYSRKNGRHAKKNMFIYDSEAVIYEDNLVIDKEISISMFGKTEIHSSRIITPLKDFKKSKIIT